MWNVRLSRSRQTPIITRLVSITLRPPRVSYKRPTKGCPIPLTSVATKNAAEIVVRFHSRSWLIGTTNTPKAFLEPPVTMAVKEVAATINQP